MDVSAAAGKDGDDMIASHMTDELAGNSAPIDIIRVARLRAAVVAGNYHVDLYRIAAAIFDAGSKPDET